MVFTWAMHNAASMPVHSCDRSSGRGVVSCGTTRDCRYPNAPAASCRTHVQPPTNYTCHAHTYAIEERLKMGAVVVSGCKHDRIWLLCQLHQHVCLTPGS